MAAAMEGAGGSGGSCLPPGGEGMSQEGQVKKERELIPLILSDTLMKPTFTDYLGSTFKIRGKAAT